MARIATSDVPWEAVYEAHAQDIARYLRHFVRDEQVALDLMQDTFARAMRAAGRPPAGELRPWLFRIASNLAVSHLRRPRWADLFALRRHAAVESRFEETEQVRQALRSISPDQAIALTLAFHEGFGRREIARLLGCSKETVKSRIARGRLAFTAAYSRLERGLKA